MEKCLLLGNGGREAVIAEYVSKDYRLYSIMPYANPSIAEYVVSSEGKYIIGDPFDKKLVKEFIENERIDTPDVVKLAMLHYQFETIHPFLGGNRKNWKNDYSNLFTK